MSRKYRFPDRATAEAEVVRQEQELTLHRIALDALLREEFTFTRCFEAPNGAWFEMGIARASAAHGGLILIREYYPVNRQPGQSVRWADTWVRETSEHFCGMYTGSDAETRAYLDCFLAVRSLYNAAIAAA